MNDVLKLGRSDSLKTPAERVLYLHDLVLLQVFDFLANRSRAHATQSPHRLVKRRGNVTLVDLKYLVGDGFPCPC